ncbi:MAG: hypothetical protein Ta2D_06250 [Rickettsiales bacterium]|nr:MAG: hypothetical protein Ta2D_06250 [Rickettsiales bacterium]
MKRIAEKDRIINPNVLQDPNDAYLLQLANRLAQKGLVIKKFISEGSFGVVYQAENKKGEVFAVKIAKDGCKEEIMSDIKKSDFIRERVSPKTHKLFTLGLKENEIEIEELEKYLKKRVFIMKKREGDLQNLIEEYSFSKDAEKESVEQMINMLSALHKESMVNPDFKLPNILYSKEGKLELADLGAIVSEGTSSYGTTYVTPEYAESSNAWTKTSIPRQVPHTKKSDSFLLGLAILSFSNTCPDLIRCFAWNRIYKTKQHYPEYAKEAQTKLFNYLKSVGYDDKVATKISQLLEYDPNKRTSVEDLLPLLNQNGIATIEPIVKKPELIIQQQLQPQQLKKLEKLEKEHIETLLNTNGNSTLTKYEKELISINKDRVTKEVNKKRDEVIKEYEITEMFYLGKINGFFNRWRKRREIKNQIKAVKDIYRDTLAIRLDSYKTQLIKDRESVVKKIDESVIKDTAESVIKEIAESRKDKPSHRMMQVGRNILQNLEHERQGKGL